MVKSCGVVVVVVVVVVGGGPRDYTVSFLGLAIAIPISRPRPRSLTINHVIGEGKITDLPSSDLISEQVSTFCTISALLRSKESKQHIQR